MSDLSISDPLLKRCPWRRLFLASFGWGILTTVLTFGVVWYAALFGPLHSYVGSAWAFTLTAFWIGSVFSSVATYVRFKEARKGFLKDLRRLATAEERAETHQMVSAVREARVKETAMRRKLGPPTETIDIRDGTGQVIETLPVWVTEFGREYGRTMDG